jgi:ribosomal protein L16 Arg81 hydroxylase
MKSSAGMWQQVEALKAVLQPGDSLVFPPRWAHHTESLSQSLSLTYRVGPRSRRREAAPRLARALLRPRSVLGGCHRLLMA